ncbi:MAG TPA: acyl carrier protein [Candidatus Dormibacteraeota bacterium]|nr:acyl carrier protein [Candidatus Dormibacteraeota bacterium]
MNSDIRKTIHDYVSSELMHDLPGLVLTDETDLLSAHIIDSLGIFTLVTFLEERFGIVIDADEVLVEHFGTVTDVVNLVESKLMGAAAQTA